MAPWVLVELRVPTKVFGPYMEIMNTAAGEDSALESSAWIGCEADPSTR
jgi:hypothetical protein